MEFLINFSKTKYIILFFLSSIGLIVIKQSGTDFLYYYLPTAEYLLDNMNFPPNLSPSYVDAPMAFPPIEYIFIALFKFTFGNVGIKVYYVLKIFTFYLLFFELSKYSKNKLVLDLFLIIPTFLIFVTIFNTDLNIVIASLTIILYFMDEVKYKKVMLIGVTFGLLSKYTFIPIYLSTLVYLWYCKKDWKFFLLPLILFSPFLYKNFILYGNPIFPLGNNFFNNTTILEKNILKSWTESKFYFSSLYVLFESLVLLAFIDFKNNKKYIISFLLIILNMYLLLTSTGTSARFFFPFSLLVLFIISNNSFNKKHIFLIILSAIIVLIFYSDSQIRFFSLFVILYIFIFFKYPKYISHFLILVYMLVISLKSVTKFDSNQEFAYSLYSEKYTTIENYIHENNIVFTDFTILPYYLRNNSKVIVYYSLLNKKIDTVMSGKFNSSLVFYLSKNNEKLIQEIKMIYPKKEIIIY